MPSQQVSARRFITAVCDFANSMLLFLLALFLGPLGFLRGPLSIEKWFWYLWMLSPSGLLSQTVRAGIEWRLGSFDAATVFLESIITECERLVNEKPKLRHRRIVLGDFYTLLARAYLHGGHIDDAMQVVQRAKKVLGVDKLPGLPRLDAKTAHLVRAGLAAGRLLEGGGLATLFVKTHETQHANPPRQGATSKEKPKEPRKLLEPTKSNVIPFPTNEEPKT